MRSLTLAIAAAVLLAAPASLPASPYWNWTVSDSDTDAFSNSGSSASGQTDYYLWFQGIAQLVSMSRADLGIWSTGPILASMEGMNGFTLEVLGNSVRVTPPAGCTGGWVPVAHLVVAPASGSLYFGPSLLSGSLCTSDCSAGTGASFYYHLGYSWDGGPIETMGSFDCPGTAVGAEPGVEAANWGRTKALYR